MKILVLTTTFPRWSNDVTPGFIFDLCKQYKNDGFEVVVLAPHDPGAKNLESLDGIKIHRFKYFMPSHFQRLAYGGGILPNFNASVLAKIQAPLLLVTELFYALRLIRKEKIDVIHSHWIIPNGLVGAICYKILGKKHIMTLHGAGLFALEKLPLKKKIANFILKNTDEVAVVSEHIKGRLLQLIDSVIPENIKGIHTIPMGVDLKDCGSAISDKKQLKEKYGINSKNVILALGRIVDKKGFSYGINAMPRILSKYPDTQLVICGDGPMKNELEKAAHDLRLNNKVIFTGYIGTDEKLEYFKLADILIVPSIVTGSGDTEGLPVVLLEGLAVGIPVIATDVGGIKDVIQNGRNGFLIKEKDSSEIANKVTMLFGDRALMANFSKNAIDTAKAYNWDTIGRKYEKLIRGE